MNEEVEYSLKKTCEEIADRYEIQFVEIGADEDHVHFLLQTVPATKLSEMIKKIKSITGRELFRLHPWVRNTLWGGQFWTSGYYVNTVGQYANEKVIQQYVKSQGKEYKQIHREQLKLL